MAAIYSSDDEIIFGERGDYGCLYFSDDKMDCYAALYPDGAYKYPE